MCTLLFDYCRHMVSRDMYNKPLAVKLQETKEIKRKLERELRETMIERQKYEMINKLRANEAALTEQVKKHRVKIRSFRISYNYGDEFS